MKSTYIIPLLIAFLAALLLLIPKPSLAKRANPESYYQNKHCKGHVEYKLDDNTRVDCLTKDLAIEFDFANKWAEGVGQALYYSAKTGKKATVALIMENKEHDQKYLKRLYKIRSKHNLDLKIIEIYK